ncbi:acetyl-CoA C-acetyltransferase, partial [Phenoliferia sp. Uapishka_3]
MSVRHGLKSILTKRPDDIVFVTSLRTPIGKFKGGFKDMYPEELLSHVLKATRERLEAQGLDVKGGAVQDMAVGTVLMELGGAKSGRLASLDAGFPNVTGFKAVNRQCASSLQSLTDIAQSIQTGMIDIGIAAGVEHMTRNYGTRAIPVDISPFIKNSPSEEARDCLMPMGLTSEAVAAQYGISRKEQDAFALTSHQKAKAAQDAGYFAEEIVPMEVRSVTPAEGDKEAVTTMKTISNDEGIRPQTTLESLAKLKPAFQTDGTGTAGNSSQISDGASAMTLARRDVAEALGLTPIARWVGSAVVGVPPKIMGQYSTYFIIAFRPECNSLSHLGVGPAYAVPALFKRFGLTKDDIDIFELNEAFASQSLMVIETLGLDISKVNPKGGAIALGHPLGATGGRLISSLIYELRRTNKQGTGAGKATLIVAE